MKTELLRTHFTCILRITNFQSSIGLPQNVDQPIVFVDFLFYLNHLFNENTKRNLKRIENQNVHFQGIVDVFGQRFFIYALFEEETDNVLDGK